MAGIGFPPDVASSTVPVPLGLGIDTLGECPVWWPEQSALCWVDVRGQLVHVLNLVSGEIRNFPTPEMTGGMCLTDQGKLLLAMESTISLLDPADGSICDVAAPPHAGESMRFNEMKADPCGRIWVGYMNDASRGVEGFLYQIGPEGYRVCLDAVAIPNSLVWSPSGDTMYFADGVEPIIWAFDFDMHLGVASHRREFARLEEGIPDGAAIDIEGGLWSANYGGGKLIRYSADGTRTDEIVLPISQPTCPAFAGQSLDVLYCATANQRLSAQELAEQPLAGELFALKVEIPGLLPGLAHESLLPAVSETLACQH